MGNKPRLITSVILGISLASVAGPVRGQSPTGPTSVFYLGWDDVQADANALTALLGGAELSWRLTEAVPAVAVHAWVDALGTASAVLVSLTPPDILRSEPLFWVRRRGVGIGLQAGAPVIGRRGWTASVRFGASAGGVWFPAYATGDPIFVKRARVDAGVFLDTRPGLEVGLQLIRAVVDASDYWEVVDSAENEALMVGARASLRLTPDLSLTTEYAGGAPGPSQIIIGLEWSGT